MIFSAQHRWPDLWHYIYCFVSARRSLYGGHTHTEHQQIDLAKQTYPHLQSLNLADSNPNNLPLDIDILIGANHYWNIIAKHQVRGKFVPVALESKLGYV